MAIMTAHRKSNIIAFLLPMFIEEFI